MAALELADLADAVRSCCDGRDDVGLVVGAKHLKDDKALAALEGEVRTRYLITGRKVERP